MCETSQCGTIIGIVGATTVEPNWWNHLKDSSAELTLDCYLFSA
jgi:hypothetical protein